MVTLAVILFGTVFTAFAVHTVYKTINTNDIKTTVMENPIDQSGDVVKIFEEMERVASESNPDLLQLIENYNTNKVGLDSLHNYQYMVNQSPMLTTTNQAGN